jgi:hypothetical protein
MAAVPLLTARQPYYQADVVSADAPAEASVPPDQEPIAAAEVPRRKPAAVASMNVSGDSTMKASAPEPTLETPAVESSPTETAVVSTAKADVADVAPVTITGCLERDGHTFRLKDTSGVDAPKSRSWRSGFFKKSTTSIELVDATYSLKLADHVGRRVAATGVLMNRELRARSLQTVAASCS